MENKLWFLNKTISEKEMFTNYIEEINSLHFVYTQIYMDKDIKQETKETTLSLLKHSIISKIDSIDFSKLGSLPRVEAETIIYNMGYIKGHVTSTFSLVEGITTEGDVVSIVDNIYDEFNKIKLLPEEERDLEKLLSVTGKIVVVQSTKEEEIEALGEFEKKRVNKRIDDIMSFLAEG